MASRTLRHPLSPIAKRSGYALLAICFVMGIGMIGLQALTGWGWVYSFFFMSMVATGQGPPIAPQGNVAEIFVSIMAFVSVGTVIAAIGVIFGPLLGYLIHKGIHFSEKEIERLEGSKKEKPKS